MILASKNIKEYLELIGLSSKDFAAKIGFDEATTSQVLNRKEEPSKNFIEQVLIQTGMKFEKAFDVKE